MAAPAKAAEYEFEWGPSPTPPDISPLARITHDISPPLIAMIAVLGTAFIIVLYARILSRHLHRWRRWRRRRRLLQSTAAVSDLESPPSPAGGASFGSSSGYFLPPYGLDDSAIKTLPISLYSKSRAKHLAGTNRECAVCLLEFEDDDSLRTLPLCSHAFHVDCIDIWLQSHATCPLCRAAVFRHESPFVPMGAARIRPRLDDLLLDPPPESPPPMPDPETEIVPAAAAASPPSIRGVDRFRDLDSLLNRSYSFGFERSLAVDRMVLDASTASPWQSRYRSFRSKRWPSPLGGFAGGGSSTSSRAARVSSFRSYRSVATKSPFFRRRGFFQLSSDPTIRLRGGAGAVVPAEPLDDEPVCADGGVLIEPVLVRGFPGAAVAGEAEPTVAGRRGVR